jgi:hypothetical protein
MKLLVLSDPHLEFAPIIIPDTGADVVILAGDRPSTSGPVPLTMANYGMSGTPTLIVIDRKGRIRLKHFGLLADMQVGSVIRGLLAEVESGTAAEKHFDSRVDSSSSSCDGNGCVI